MEFANVETFWSLWMAESSFMLLLGIFWSFNNRFVGNLVRRSPHFMEKQCFGKCDEKSDHRFFFELNIIHINKQFTYFMHIPIKT